MDADIEAVLHAAAARNDLTADERAYLAATRRPESAELARTGDRALRAGATEAASAYRDAAGLVPSERMLLWKARVLRPAPRLVGPLVRARQLRIEQSVGFDDRHAR